MANERKLTLTVLAVDSAGSACSAAVWRDGTTLAHLFAPMEHGHAEALIPMVQEVMATAGLDYADVDLIAATCEQTLVMDFGRRLALGPTAEVLVDPKVRRAYLGA